eukprot:gb/GFBE01000682.1/.p1 GENE.gb/GFBE01000682.1/~~gb/GFBE01000682.1/.p1  ORF type:complete len:379 (+),score=106.16 gb/GFBE01000682.1/:1-1137(+)
MPEMRAAAPSFCPAKPAGVLPPGRVTTGPPPGLAPPPGLDPPSEEDLKPGAFGSPASTMLPSSPFVSPLMGFQDDLGSEAGGRTSQCPSPFMMPKMDPSPWGPAADGAEEDGYDIWGFELQLSPQGDAAPVFEGDFKLEGLSILENSLASLLGDIMKPNCADINKLEDASTGSSGATTPPSSTCEKLPDEQGPSSPTLSEAEDVAPAPEALPKPVATSTGEKVGWAQPLKPAAVEPTASEAESTVLLKNLPKKCSAEQLQEVLAEKGLLKDVSFLYVPMDLKMKRCNQGHAVISFRSQEARAHFTETMHGASSKQAFPGSSANGTCSVSDAPVQGKSANVYKLQKSGLLLSMLAGTPEWMPRVFDEEGNQLDFPEESE